MHRSARVGDACDSADAGEKERTGCRAHQRSGGTRGRLEWAHEPSQRQRRIAPALALAIVLYPHGHYELFHGHFIHLLHGGLFRKQGNCVLLALVLNHSVPIADLRRPKKLNKRKIKKEKRRDIHKTREEQTKTERGETEETERETKKEKK